MRETNGAPMNARHTTTDRLDQAYAAVGVLMGKLSIRARNDLESAVGPSASLDGPVSGGGHGSSTEAGLERLRQAGDFNRICGAFEKVQRILFDLHEELTPVATGEMCPTQARDVKSGRLVACEAPVTHRGRCVRCHQFWRRNGYGPDAVLLAEWNGRLERDCTCGPDCCPDGCGDRVSATKQRWVSDRCRKRQERNRGAA